MTYPYSTTPVPSRYSLTGRAVSTGDRGRLETLHALARDARDSLPGTRAALAAHLPTGWEILAVPFMGHLRTPTEVKGKPRQRALCPLCGRDGFLLSERDGTLSAHGYQRNGGWQSGECAGSHRTPEQALAILLDRFDGIRSATSALGPDRLAGWLDHETERLSRMVAPYADDAPHNRPRWEAKLLIEYRSLKDEGMESRFFRRMVRSREDVLQSQWASLSAGLAMLLDAQDRDA